jgi:hypothetical protein
MSFPLIFNHVGANGICPLTTSRLQEKISPPEFGNLRLLGLLRLLRLLGLLGLLRLLRLLRFISIYWGFWGF